MTTMVSELYDALKSAGADDQKARAAAEAMADHRDYIKKIDSKFLLLHWMIAFNLAFTMTILWKITP